MSNNLFGFNTQQQKPQNGNQGGLFANNNNSNPSLFGNTNTSGGGLFGNNINNNNNKTATTSNENKGGLFGNTSSNTGSNLFGNNNLNNAPPPKNNLFGATNTNTQNTNSVIFGNFQNDNTNKIFDQKNTQTNNQQNTQQNNKGEGFNSFSLFSNNNATQSQPEKPKENTNTNQTSLFTNMANNSQNGTGLFGAPKQEEKKPENINNANQTQTQAQPQIQKKEETDNNNKSQNNLFGNNINTQATTGNNNLFGIQGNKSSQAQAQPSQNNNPNPNPNLASNILNANNNQNEQNNKNIINEDSKNKVPDKPFDLSLITNCKELEEYEKKQMLYKTNKDILVDFKNMLSKQKIKYKKCVENTRFLEKKIMDIIRVTSANSRFSEMNIKKGNNIINKINGINYQSKNLENVMITINDKLSQTLNPYKDNVMNSDKLLLNQNGAEKFKFYENFEEISDKCYSIENILNEAEQNLIKKGKEIDEKNNKDNNGVWIERNKKKIFVNQNEVNNLFSECYDGLNNLKNMQDIIDKNYENLKLKLMKNMENNNYINNNYNYNMNDIY